MNDLLNLNASKIVQLKPNSSELALYYAGMGIPVFPLNPFTKTPSCGFKWSRYSTTDAEIIKGIWDGKAHINSAVGLVTGKQSNILVIDVDNKNGHLGDVSFANLLQSIGLENDFNTFTVSTPSGGFHYYLEYNDCGLTIGADIMDGIDFRGEGGYVVAAGSLTPKGGYIAHV